VNPTASNSPCFKATPLFAGELASMLQMSRQQLRSLEELQRV
jgi:hypothetical protein